MYPTFFSQQLHSTSSIECIELPFPRIACHRLSCHDPTIDRVVNMTSHGCLSLNMFYVIKHHPHILQIITWIKLLPYLLTKKIIVINIIIIKWCFQFWDIVNGARITRMFTLVKQWNCVCQGSTKEWTLTTFDLVFHLWKLCRTFPSLMNKWWEINVLLTNKTMAKVITIGVWQTLFTTMFFIS